MEDFEVDCEDYSHSGYLPHGRVHHQTDMKKMSSNEEQVDSGLGSLGYVSGELSNVSLDLPAIEEERKKENTVPSLGSLDIADSLSRLNIDRDSKHSSDRCDSGVEDIKSSMPSAEYELALENWISPDFSPEQIVDIFRGDEDGDNHLHLSIIHALPRLTMQIIGLVPDLDWLNQTNNLLQTPLHLAVITRQRAVVRRLICAGAYVEVLDQLGNTPLHNACRLGFDDIVLELITPVKYEETCQNKYRIPFQRLPQNLEAKNYEGLTPLHLAAVGGHIHVMKQLLNAGANVNAADGKSGRTVLHFAAEWGNLPMVRYLLSRKDTNINACTYSGLTPILLAYGRSFFNIVEELYNSGAACDTLSLNEDSDTDISDEEMAEESLSNRRFGALTCGEFQQPCR